MSPDSIEQRKYKRLYFPTHEMIRAVFSFSGDKQLTFESKVLNLSELGLGLVVPKSDTNSADDLKAGDILRLKEIVGSPDLKFVREIKSEIRWVANAQWMDNIGFGCEFIEISAELREKINSFINVAEETMDNYFVSLDELDNPKMG
jgi:c-di-GMP-binding flagellar brake protein YcgR